MSRGLALVDHLRRDGVSGFLTITGGKLTTYRLMAETVVDAMCEQLGEARPCRTAEEALPGSEDGAHLLARLAPGGARGGHGRGPARLRVRAAAAARRSSRRPRRRPGMNLDDLRRHAAARHGALPGRLLHLPRRRASSTASGTPTPSAPTSWC